MIARRLLPAALLVLLLGPARAGDDPDPLAAARALETEIATTIERVKPSVVAVLARGVEPGGTRPRSGGGSGVIVDAAGLVLTNDHVVGWASDIVVIAPGRRRVKAKLVGRDPEGDLALIELTGEGPWPAVTLGDSDAVRPGQRVLAMGNPRGIAIDGEPAVTSGVVTALHCLGGGRSDSGLFYGDAIQTDAEINPGNSGGPLFDVSGNLLGINGRIATRIRVAAGAVNTNVGFAIPANQIRRFLPRLRKGEEIRHGYLGVRVQAVEGGVRIVHVVPGSPAARCGLAEGDLVLTVDGIPVLSDVRLTNLVSAWPAGDRVAIRYRRADRSRIRIVTLGARPRPEEAGK